MPQETSIKTLSDVAAPEKYTWVMFSQSLVDKWIPVILSGIMLATINNLYWIERNKSELAQDVFKEKIDTIVNFNVASSDLLNNINNYVSSRDDESSETKEDDYRKPIDAAIRDLSKSATRLNLLFSKKVSDLIASFFNEIHKDPVEQMQLIGYDSPLSEKWKLVKDQVYREIETSQVTE